MTSAFTKKYPGMHNRCFLPEFYADNLSEINMDVIVQTIKIS